MFTGKGLCLLLFFLTVYSENGELVDLVEISVERDKKVLDITWNWLQYFYSTEDLSHTHSLHTTALHLNWSCPENQCPAIDNIVSEQSLHLSRIFFPPTLLICLAPCTRGLKVYFFMNKILVSMQGEIFISLYFSQIQRKLLWCRKKWENKFLVSMHPSNFFKF